MTEYAHFDFRTNGRPSILYSRIEELHVSLRIRNYSCIKVCLPVMNNLHMEVMGDCIGMRNTLLSLVHTLL